MLRIAVVGALALCAIGATTASTAPRCWGAADRDPLESCQNPRLRLTVKPTPDRALLIPNIACTREKIDETVEQCSYGAPREEAVQTVALIGDSHAAHWRGALSVMARRERWRVVEIGSPHCPLSADVPRYEGRDWCGRWNETVLEWLASHPEIRTVFTSNHSRAPIVVPEGHSEFAQRTEGYVAMWNRLPASVERLVVLRDVPLERVSTHDCVRRAIKRRRPAGPGCAVPRRKYLHKDAALPASARVPRAQLIDLTPHFCSRTRCYPVVGGVLVHKDLDHITQDFARTLGPYVLRGVKAHAAG